MPVAPPKQMSTAKRSVLMIGLLIAILGGFAAGGSFWIISVMDEERASRASSIQSRGKNGLAFTRLRLLAHKSEHGTFIGVTMADLEIDLDDFAPYSITVESNEDDDYLITATAAAGKLNTCSSEDMWTSDNSGMLKHVADGMEGCDKK